MSHSSADPSVAIVIPSFNSLATLRACIASIRETAGYADYRITVVDAGSTDGTLEWLSSESEIELLEASGPCVASAVNTGILASAPADVVRVHADVVFETAGWLKRLVEAATLLPEAGVVGVKLVYPGGRIQSVGRHIVHGLGAHEQHANRQAFGPDKDDRGPAVEVDSVPGAVSYYRRTALDDVGGLDENYTPAHWDDDDFCMMARWHGYKVYVDPAIRAVHHTSAWSPTTKTWIPDHENELPALPIPKLHTLVTARHVDYWHEKWGWNPRHPDVNEIRRLYGDTEICWQIGGSMRFQPQQWPPAVDVAMVTWNNVEKLAECLQSLAHTTYPALRVYIVDNGSTDRTLEYLEQLESQFPFPLHVTSLPVNTGVAVGLNWAITQGEGELVARLDDDVSLPPDWLSKLVQNFRKRPYAGVVGPKILNNNSNRDIQCAGFRHYPYAYGHDSEPDHGQADYLARSVHVRGCCNVYRRDALDRCGLLDLRYSPSQWDDPDHHVSFAKAGYEILYDGTVAVVHELTNGKAQSQAAIANQLANRSKLDGKWGTDVWAILDRALELSREGRFLPPDGDTSAYLSRLPSPNSFPRFLSKRLDSAEMRQRLSILRFKQTALSMNGPLGHVWVDHLALASAMRRDGRTLLAVEVLSSLVDLLPREASALTALASIQLVLGRPLVARQLLERARRLSPEDESVISQIAQLEGASADTAVGSPQAYDPNDRSHAIGEEEGARSRVQGSGKLKVLMLNSYEPRVAGGDMHQIKKTRQYLEKLGVDVDVSYRPVVDSSRYDLVHVFNLWFPHQTLPQVKALRVAAPDLPIVMTPIYWDMREKQWADHAVPWVFTHAKSPQDLEGLLRAMARDTLQVNGVRRAEAREPNFKGYEDYQREILRHVDHLVAGSEREMRVLSRSLGVEIPPYQVAHNSAEPTVFDQATPDWFVDQYGLRDFVLTVGLVEPRKNQLMLLQALRPTDLPVVVIGRNYDRSYLKLCRKYGGPNVRFIEHLPHAQLASALKAARVYALPSWMECASLANTEAALSGCALALSNRTSEPEYYEDCAYYCDPADTQSIRQAVVSAYDNYEADADKRERLSRRFREEFTWERAAEQTLAAYEAAIAARRRGASAVPIASATVQPTISA
jgi:GT2 family glycosyltransferase/glycosyltransferase involved in cell wall biosynthesis